MLTDPTPGDHRALAILPTLNEAKNLPLLVPRILAHDGFRVLVVDDRSTDGTGDVAEDLARQFPGRVDVDVIVQMDADLSHDPQHLPAMVAANAYVRTITGLGARDCTSGYRCWRRSAVQQIQWDRVGAEGFGFWWRPSARRRRPAAPSASCR